MDSLVIYPTTAQQFSLIQSLMEEMKVRFTVKTEKKKDDSLFTKDEYYAMLDASIQEAKEGKVYRMKDGQSVKDFLKELCTA